MTTYQPLVGRDAGSRQAQPAHPAPEAAVHPAPEAADPVPEPQLRFEEAVSATIAELGASLPLDLWMLTRVEQSAQVVVASAGPWAGHVPAGTVLPWLQSFCLHLVAGTAPALAPRTQDVPQYARAATGRWAKVRGYIGAPVQDTNGELYGTLSGYSASADDPRVLASAPTVRFLGKAMTAAWAAAQLVDLHRLELQRALRLADVDVLTGIPNRRGWYAGLQTEGHRISRYGHGAAVIAIDVDNLKLMNDTSGHPAGDDLLRATADALRHACRPTDVVARTGGDEFAILAVETDPGQLHALLNRVRERLAEAGIAASLGQATHSQTETLAETWTRADQALYAEKSHRRTAGPAQNRHIALCGPQPTTPPDRSPGLAELEPDARTPLQALAGAYAERLWLMRCGASVTELVESSSQIAHLERTCVGGFGP